MVRPLMGLYCPWVNSPAGPLDADHIAHPAYLEVVHVRILCGVVTGLCGIFLLVTGSGHGNLAAGIGLLSGGIGLLV